jgi:GNAT superfamily N-acetyltransferase
MPRGAPGLALRPAAPADCDWVNARYAEADFQPSDATHLVLIAEVDGARAGLGRLVPAGPGVVELGGMYVLPAYRGGGVAASLITALLAAAAGARVYCIPYAHLAPLYERAGFAPVEEGAAVPASVREKLAWCKQHYAQPVRLMQYGGGAGRT